MVCAIKACDVAMNGHGQAASQHHIQRHHYRQLAAFCAVHSARPAGNSNHLDYQCSTIVCCQFELCVATVQKITEDRSVELFLS